MPILILFDGVCNLCNGFVDFVIKRDPKAKFRFASLQSEEALKSLKPYHIALKQDSLSTIIVVADHRVHFRSDAVIRVAQELGFPWNVSLIFKLLPRGFRDALYQWVARNRYNWFGKKDTCRIPSAEERQRFL